VSESPKEKSTSLILTSSSLSLQIETKEINGNYAEKITLNIIHPPPVVVPEDEDEVLVKGWRKYRGIVLALQSSLIFSITALLVKQLKDHNPITIALWRYQGALWPGLLALAYHRTSGPEKEKVAETIFPPTTRKKLKMLLLLIVRTMIRTIW
jgi:hypothetical protein